MSSSSNGRHGGPHDPTRRLRYDLSTLIEQARPRGPRRGHGGTTTVPMPWLGPRDSGRRFVILAAVGLLLVSGVLYIVFREWRTRYRARAAYGAEQVAPAIDVLAERVPRGVDPARWRDAVNRTHAMLVTVTASNLLGLSEMRDLRSELQRAAARVRDRRDTAVAELAAVWDDMAERGEFLLRDTRGLKGDRHPRPGILPTYGEDRVAPGLDPFTEIEPPGVEAARWREAIDGTRAFLLDVTASRRMSTMRMSDLRKEIDQAATRSQDHPETAVRELAAVWDGLARMCPDLFLEPRSILDRHPRPEAFPQP